MSKTALAWTIGLLTGTVLNFRDPIFGLLTYLWEYYNHPPLRWWGNQVPDWRWSLLMGTMLLVSYTLHGKTLFRREIFRHRQTQWLVGFFIITALVTTFLAIDPVRSRGYVLDLGKLTVLFCLIIGVVDSYRKYQWVTAALILGALSWGVDAYLDPNFSDGRLIQVGGPDSYDDNAAAAHVIPVLPFLALYFWYGNKWQRVLAIVSAPFIINMIILCNSRGASAGIAVALLAGVLLMQWRLRLRLALVALVSVPVLLTLVDQNFIERQWTLVDYLREGPAGEAAQYDGATTERLISWGGALELIADQPLGVGGGGFDMLSPVYAREVVERHEGELRAVHNTYLWVGSDWGVVGLIAFLGFIVSGLLALHRIRRESKNERLRLESLALEVGLIAFLGAAVFINRQYAEILYWLMALSAALANIHEADAAGDRGTSHAPSAAVARAA